MKIKINSITVFSVKVRLVEDCKMMAADLTISSEIATGLYLQADQDLLRQILVNLISNAVKYNIENGWMKVVATQASQKIIVKVSNACKGIAVEARDKLFERFYRVDSAHHRKVDGAGLGLGLSREIARAHGGEVSINHSESTDVEFVLTLPTV